MCQLKCSAVALHIRVSQIATVLALLAALILATPPRAAAQRAFYDASTLNLATAKPGALLRSETMPGAPAGSTAYRVLYRSTGLSGEPIAVSGVVIVPAGPAPAEGRRIIAWAHPTTGVEPQCAPSLARVFFDSIQGLNLMLNQGYVVTATDYPGLGTSEVHPYLVGESEGRAVLDSVRVARAVAGPGTRGAFGVWGHSQGGHAALFSAILAARYAPELRLVGVAAAAPATELGTLLNDDLNTSGGKNVTAMTLWSWSRVYKVPIGSVVTPAAVPAIDRLAGECIERWFDILIRRGPTADLDKSFLKTPDFTRLSPWRGLIASNSPGLLPKGTPLFLAQGTADGLVVPAVTFNYRSKLCKAGRSVQLDLLQGVGHAFAGRDAAPAAIQWMDDRFAGKPAPSNCSMPVPTKTP
jgi:acetyl esterase/lipase